MQKEIGRVFGGVALLAIFGSVTATADDWKTCANTGLSEFSSDDAIAACTRQIMSNEYRGEDLGLLFFNRGIQYRNEGRYDVAIQDFDQAIRLNPEDAWALYNRGMAKKKVGDTSSADADIAKALQLQPDIEK